MITAPFNFVPLSEKVFFPDWADSVSHDIPFSDGESGVIDITITAKSPIFIRNHSSDKTNPSSEFCNHNGEYYIPATSVKGMVRNILEIMSFSKMSFIDDKTYSLRDLKYDKYLDEFKDNKVQCGWLYKDENGNLKIEDCGAPYRISYDEIERKFRNNFKSNFLINERALSRKRVKDEVKELIATGSFDDARSPYKNAYKKYELIDEDIQNIVYNFSKSYKDNPGREIVNFEDNGENRGKLVLTGHPSARFENSNSDNPEKIKASGKIYDFVFKELNNSDIYDVDDKVFDNFKFAYFDGRKTQPKESEDWSYWKSKLNNGGRVPIFFHKNKDRVTSFGLSYLYKFPYKKSILKALVGQHTKDDIDLAESIFGYTKKIKDEQISLKGRVQFSHGIEKENTIINVDTPRDVLLGSPKASYYPIYIVQNGNKYTTLMDGGAVLAGWKRYPIHKTFNHKGDTPSTQTSTITPLKKGATFKMKVRVHNLNKVELGALLSALTFHDCEECYHSMGMAKPLGYGKIKLTVDSLKGFTLKKEDYLKAFEASMNSEIFKDKIEWYQSEQIKNLLSMAVEQENSGDSVLKYMELKDFAKEKNNTNYFKRYIELNNIKTKEANNLCSNSDIRNYKKSIEPFIKKQEEKNHWNRIKDSSDIENFKDFMEEYQYSIKKELALEKIADIQKELVKEEDNRSVEEWERIIKNRKYLTKERIEQFRKDFPNSSKLEEAQKELEQFNKKEKPKEQSNTGSIFANAKSAGELNSIANSNKISEENIQALKDAILEIYNKLKNNKQPKFVKELKKKKKIVEWLGSEDSIDEVIQQKG